MGKPPIDENFYASEAGQFIATASMYVRSARIVRESNDWQRQATMLSRPTLHLLAHAVEMLLKFPLVYNGHAPNEVKVTFGHKLVDLWNQPANRFIRKRVAANARKHWAHARDSGMWPNDDFSPEPTDVVEKAVVQLGRLSGKDTSFALKYLYPENEPAPRSAFLIDVFGDTIEEGVGNPWSLIHGWSDESDL